MEIRRTRPEDLDDILAVYAHGREIMKRTGNVTQWGDSRPPLSSILGDIENGNSYAVTENGKIHAVFAFLMGPDPTYDVIDGAWLNDNEYAVIHRIASDECVKGVLRAAVDHAARYCDDIRIDTHRDNVIMRHLIEKLGFTECGIIITDDGTERLAFHRHRSQGEEK